MSFGGLAAQARAQKYSQVHLQLKGGGQPGEGSAASKVAGGEAIREAGAAGGGGRF